MSATQRWSERSAVKSRCSRSGAGHDRGVAALAELAAGVRTDQAVVGHQFRHPVVTDPLTAATELSGDTWRPIGARRRFVDLADLDQQRHVRELAVGMAGASTRRTSTVTPRRHGTDR